MNNKNKKIHLSNNIFLLFTLGALWGGSFLFIRILSPEIGATNTILSRVGIASLFLTCIILLKKESIKIDHWRIFFIIGLLNGALPFTLFAFAAKNTSTATLSILNATTPIWSLLLSYAFLGSKIDKRTVFGIIIGLIGVYLLASTKSIGDNSKNELETIICIAATISYAIAAIYTKKISSKLTPLQIAHGSMWSATLILLPVSFLYGGEFIPSSKILISVAALGIASTGIAYLIFFRLIRDMGATAALYVTFIIPLFGIIWGWLFLGETIKPVVMVGAALILTSSLINTKYRTKNKL